MTALTAEIAAIASAVGDVIDTFRVRGHDNDDDEDGEQGRDDMPRLSEGCGGQRVHVHHQMGVKRADKIALVIGSKIALPSISKLVKSSLG